MSKSIPITTQIVASGQIDTTQQDVKDVLFIFVMYDNETERQSHLLQEVIRYVAGSGPPTECVTESQLKTMPPRPDVSKEIFVLSSYRKDIIDFIQKRFGEDNLSIVMARVLIEQMRLGSQCPSRSLTLSFSMLNCKIFVTEAKLANECISKIYPMCGELVLDPAAANVILVDKANRSCTVAAHKQGKPVVSKRWLEYYWKTATDDDESNFHQSALSDIRKHLIKPFFGLRIKIEIEDGRKRKAMEKLISENEGTVVCGNIQPKKTKDKDSKNYIHYILREKFEDCPLNPKNDVKYLDCRFLELCLESGRLISFKDYASSIKPSKLMNGKNKVKLENLKKERNSQPRIGTNKSTEENRTPSTQETMIDDAQASDMLTQTSVFHNNTEDLNIPPPTNHCQYKQPDHMNEMILRALAFDTPQTQLASTQMRRLPDSELRIEQTFEPSQQICWNDCSSRR